jgi:predicted DNA-binding transcriptional regulator AlpA
MNTVFLLMAQFNSATLTIDQVCALLGGKAKQTVRNRVSRGTFPRPTADGIWRVQDVADYLDSTASAPSRLQAA